MLSDFRKKKLLYIYKNVYDTDENGIVDKKDFIDSLKLIAKLHGYKDSDIDQSDYDLADKVWKGLLDAADKNKDGEIDADEWIAMWDAQDKDSVLEWQELYYKLIFDVEGTSEETSINCDEYVEVFTGFGTPKDQAIEAFQKLSEGKSSLSWEDLQKRFEEFYMSDDENAPGTYLLATNKFD